MEVESTFFVVVVVHHEHLRVESAPLLSSDCSSWSTGPCMLKMKHLINDNMAIHWIVSSCNTIIKPPKY